MIIYGTGSKQIGNFRVERHQCAYCNTQEQQEISVFGKYLHVFWIPFFPIGKKVFSECTHCKKTIEKNEFSQDLNHKFEAKKHLVKRPFYHWAGLILIALLVSVAAVGAAMVKDDPRSELLHADLGKMVSEPNDNQPGMYIVKMMLSADTGIFTADESDKYRYFINVKKDKFLVLIKMTNLKELPSGSREVILDGVEEIMASQDELKGKKGYFGLMGKYNMMVVKTPKNYANETLASEAPLYEFYGATPTVE